MDNPTKSVAHRVCEIILRPLASMMLRCGMTWKEFSDLSKVQFVKAATEEFGIRGRPTNVSRVSILTGISRKEVKRQRDLLALQATPVKTKTTDATRLLSAWFQDPNYVDELSKPRFLPEFGPVPSFESLCYTYGGDVAASTMLKELLTTLTVERTSDGLLEPKKRYYRPGVADDESLILAAGMMKDLSETVNADLFDETAQPPRFLGHADNTRLPVASVPEFRSFMNDRGQAFLEEADAWLTAREHQDTSELIETLRLGVGIYTIQDSAEKTKE